MADLIPLPVLAEIHSALDEPKARSVDRSQQLAIAGDVAYRAGVAEGRRHRDAEIAADVLASARMAAAEAGFGPVPESVTVTYEVTSEDRERAWLSPAMVSMRPGIEGVLDAVDEFGQACVVASRSNPDDVSIDQGLRELKGRIELGINLLEEKAEAAGAAEGRRQSTEERIEELPAVAPIVLLEFVVALPPGNTLLGQAGVQAVLDRLGVTKAGDTAVRGAGTSPGEFPPGTSFIAYTVPVTHG